MNERERKLLYFLVEHIQDRLSCSKDEILPEQKELRVTFSDVGVLLNKLLQAYQDPITYK